MSLAEPQCRTERQRGVGLIEVLIAMVVLSIGFAASARFQVMSMRENQRSLYRGQANMLIDSMIASMHSNPAGVQSGAYDFANTNTANVPGSCSQVLCTPKQLALEDIASWRNSIAPLDGSLPKLPIYENGSPAQGTISMPSNGIYTLTITWEAMIDGELQEDALAMSFRP